MRTKSWFRSTLILSWVMVFALVLAACPADEPEPTPEPTPEPVVVEDPTPTPEEPTPEPPTPEPEPEPVVRTGAWVDEVVGVEEESAAAAVTRLEVGEIDVYAFTVTDAEVAERVALDPDLDFVESFGSYSELTFNPSGPVFEGTGNLNPFSVPRIREAVNWLIDRDFIAEELHGGMAIPKVFPITASFPDYARMVDVARALERQYAHNPELAEQIITEEMEALGAEMVNGTWHYEGEPVELILLIRTEDERREIGDYLATLFEDLGFVVERDYRTAAEAGPIWLGSAPAEGLYHIYTGGWITTVVARDQATNFDFFYTPRGLARPLWEAYEPTEEFNEVSDRLARRDFRTLEEREELFSRALELALEDSVRVWLVDRLAITPFRAEVSVAADLAGAVAGAYLWAFTARKGDEVGGTLNIAMPSMLPSPWNPVGGSNWIYDMMMIRATGDWPTMYDPYTGLHWPQRIERAEVVIEEGLPVDVTHDWVSLDFAESIEVPEDAWSDWDPVEQRWITVAERFPEGVTANRKVVIYYPDDLFETTQWHDGSPMSLGDIVLKLILTFDRAKEESAIFDAAEVPAFESFIEHFRGIRIVQEDPLIIETYSDLFHLDAELNAALDAAAWWAWPYYAQGPGAWHNLALGILAEANEELGFTESKADRLEIEHMSFIAGPSIEILEGHQTTAEAEGHIPYAATLGQFVSDEEASQRWANLRAWYEEKGHFWIGLGPLFLERAFPIEKTVHLRRYEEYPDLADKWERFEVPMIADVDIDGPARVTIGEEAEFEVWVTFQDEPYAVENIGEVKYLVFDATGELALVGDAEAVADGVWRVVLSEEETGQLPAGANRLEVAVVPLLVSIPSFDSVEFVTTP